MRKKISHVLSKYKSIIPIVIIIAIVPLIVLSKTIFYDNEVIQKIYGTICNNDLFAYYKSNTMLICSVLAILAVYNKFCIEKPVWKKYYIFSLLGIFALLNVLSALFSGFIRLSFMGAPDRYEGASIWVSYCVIAFCTVILIDNKDRLKVILYAFLFSIFGVCIIGVFQTFGLDLFSTPVGGFLITLFSKDHNISVGGGNRIYSTLYGPNVMGAFTSMAFVIVLTLMVFEKSKKIKIGLSVFSCLVFINLLCNYSRLGYLGALSGSIVIVIVGFRHIKKHPVHIIIMMIVYLMIGIGIDSYSNGQLSGRVSSLGYEATSMTDKRDDLEDVIMDKNSIKLVFPDQEFNIVYNDKTNLLNFYDENRSPITYIYDKEKSEIVFDEGNYKEYSLFFRDNGTINLSVRGFAMTFRYMEGKFIFADTNRLANYIVEDISYRADKWFFGLDISDQAGSGRGYIWSRTVPLLKKAVLLGYGPDTFAIHFPQNDYVAKLKTRGIGLTIVDKPHNMYLQIAMGSGIVSLIVFLVFIMIYSVSLFLLCFRFFRQKDDYDLYAVVALMSLSGVIACLVSNLFNDSTVSTGGYFWVMIGLGILCRMQLLDKGTE